MSAASKALGNLLRDSKEWRGFFRRCCEEGPLRVRAVVHQWRKELEARGRVVAAEDLEDALMVAAHKLLPDSLGARWDPDWAVGLVKGSIARLGERYEGLAAADRYALDLSGQHPWHDRMQAAVLENDPVAFRAALRGWERVALEPVL
ncbi:MAG: hypothetical protein M3R38_18590 [Actinomycetota bacterium]|nr:hypothetical protein [Actinomycetota bacterium]